MCPTCPFCVLLTEFYAVQIASPASSSIIVTRSTLWFVSRIAWLRIVPTVKAFANFGRKGVCRIVFIVVFHLGLAIRIDFLSTRRSARKTLFWLFLSQRLSARATISGCRLIYRLASVHPTALRSYMFVILVPMTSLGFELGLGQICLTLCSMTFTLTTS